MFRYRALMTLVLLLSGPAESSECVNSWRSIFHGVVRDKSGAPMRHLPLSHGIIVDSNILSYVVNTNGRRSEDVERIVGRIAKLKRIALKKDGQFHFYVTDTTAIEVGVASGPERTGFAFPEGTRRILLDIDPNSNEYQGVLSKLDELGVGRSSRQSGVSDRRIVADAVFAQTTRGQVPTLWTADRGLYMPLCRLSPVCKRAIEKGTVIQDMADGFEIEFSAGRESRRLRILPFFGRAPTESN